MREPLAVVLPVYAQQSLGGATDFGLLVSSLAIGTLFGLMFVPMIVAGLFGESGIAVGRFVPLLMLLNSIAVTSPIPGLFSGWVSSLLMCGYAAAAILCGGVLLRHRNA